MSENISIDIQIRDKWAEKYLIQLATTAKLNVTNFTSQSPWIFFLIRRGPNHICTFQVTSLTF